MHWNEIVVSGLNPVQRLQSRATGVRPAMKRIHDLVEQGSKFYFRADIIDFFGKVDRQNLWSMFSKRVRQKTSAATLLDVLNFYDNRFNIVFTQQQKTDLVATLAHLILQNRRPP